MPKYPVSTIKYPLFYAIANIFILCLFIVDLLIYA